MTMTEASWQAALPDIAASAQRAGVFGDVRVEGDRLLCDAAESAEPATYGLELVDGEAWVSLVMADRWQSESIESELVHTGDKLEELLDEELAELGYDSSEHGEPTYQHYRSEDMLFTFRSRVPTQGLGGEALSQRLAVWLLGYEACFRQLGDMDTSGDDE